TVPWKGDPTNAHPVYSGGTLFVQGIASNGYNDTAFGVTSASWDFGDGSPTFNFAAGSSSNFLATPHVYTGSDGTPYTATLTVHLGTETATGTFKVVVKTKTLDVEQDMAIDKGLWYLWTNANRTVVGFPSVNAAYWSFGGQSAATASAVQAFEVNNHLEA